MLKAGGRKGGEGQSRYTLVTREQELAMAGLCWLLCGALGRASVVEGGEMLGADWPSEPGTRGQPRPFSHLEAHPGVSLYKGTLQRPVFYF